MRSVIDRWSETVPGSNDQKWNKDQIAKYWLLHEITAKAIGGPLTVVDELEKWVGVAEIDGFNLSHTTNPESFVDATQFVLSELRKRGLFRREAEYEGTTVRRAILGQDLLLSSHCCSQFR